LISGHPLVLQSFQDILKKEPLDVHALLLETTLASGLRAVSAPDAPVFVVDANLPGPAMEALLGGILEQSPKVRIIAVAESFSENASFALLRLGVKGLLDYKLAATELARAIPMVGSGGYWVPREILARFLDTILQGPQSQRLRLAGFHELSPREQQTLDYLLQNLANKEIADKMKISERP
jgi:DNA-binding NarL/FixJ family response regulator